MWADFLHLLKGCRLHGKTPACLSSVLVFSRLNASQTAGQRLKRAEIDVANFRKTNKQPQCRVEGDNSLAAPSDQRSH